MSATMTLALAMIGTGLIVFGLTHGLVRQCVGTILDLFDPRDCNAKPSEFCKCGRRASVMHDSRPSCLICADGSWTR